MSPEEFSPHALALPKAEEVLRHGRSYFRGERRAFASLHGPADSIATLSLTSEQAMFIDLAPKIFAPEVGGGDGRLGAADVSLARANAATVESALGVAWRNIAPKSLLRQINQPGARGDRNESD